MPRKQISDNVKKQVFEMYVKGIDYHKIGRLYDVHYQDVLYILRTHFGFGDYRTLDSDTKKQLIIDVNANIDRETILRKYKIWHRAYKSIVSKVKRMNKSRRFVGFPTLVSLSKNRAKKLVENLDLPNIPNIKNWLWLYYTLDLLRTAQEKNLSADELAKRLNKYKQEVLYGIEIDETNQTRN